MDQYTDLVSEEVDSAAPDSVVLDMDVVAPDMDVVVPKLSERLLSPQKLSVESKKFKGFIKIDKNDSIKSYL